MITIVQTVLEHQNSNGIFSSQFHQTGHISNIHVKNFNEVQSTEDNHFEQNTKECITDFV